MPKRLPSLILGVILSCSPGLSTGSPLDDLQLVGRASFKWSFLRIYESALYSRDGNFRDVESDLALHIRYYRNITRERLIQTTREQWQALGLSGHELAENWLSELRDIWPDIAKGDELTLRIDQNFAANFYMNGVYLGSVESPEFSRHFLAIWLSPASDFAELGLRLKGKTSN